jgi:hypothetical protein
MFLDNTRKFLRDLSIQTEFMTFLRRLPNTDHSLIGQGSKLFGDIRNFLLLLRFKVFIDSFFSIKVNSKIVFN